MQSPQRKPKRDNEVETTSKENSTQKQAGKKNLLCKACLKLAGTAIVSHHGQERVGSYNRVEHDYNVQGYFAQYG